MIHMGELVYTLENNLTLRPLVTPDVIGDQPQLSYFIIPVFSQKSTYEPYTCFTYVASIKNVFVCAPRGIGGFCISVF
jgi:hypothetical protein